LIKSILSYSLLLCIKLVLVLFGSDCEEVVWVTRATVDLGRGAHRVRLIWSAYLTLKKLEIVARSSFAPQLKSHELFPFEGRVTRSFISTDLRSSARTLWKVLLPTTRTSALALSRASPRASIAKLRLKLRLEALFVRVYLTFVQFSIRLPPRLL
jgi:hypothetical protein